MSNKINELANVLAKSVKEASSEKLAPYDTTATVRRIEDGYAWVHIPGGVDETPVRMATSCQIGDTVQVRVSGGSAFLIGNVSAPPTDDTTAIISKQIATEAKHTADMAIEDADRAKEAADSAEASANTAQQSATTAQQSAQTAQEAADTALVNLATTEDVVGVVNWITAHGTMTSQSGGTFVDGQVYFVREAGGDYHVGDYYYNVVSQPVAEDINSYYVLSIDESVQNYVATHIAVDTEGLWIIPDSGGNKVLIATGAGSTYSVAGTYIVGSGSVVLAKFTADGAQIGPTANGQARSVINSGGMHITRRDNNGNDIAIADLGYDDIASNPTKYYTLGKRLLASNAFDDTQTYSKGDMCYRILSNGTRRDYVCIANITEPHAWRGTEWAHYLGDCSFAEGEDVISIGYTAHAEGYKTIALRTSDHAEGFGSVAKGNTSHAEGYKCVASATNSHAEGSETIAGGYISHASGEKTEASRRDQFVIGKYNEVDTHGQYTDDLGDYAFIIGNGTSSARSNALTVDWYGNVNIPTGTAYKVGGVSLVDLIYPVGSIYMSVSSTSPATLFGGTWQQIEDTFLLAAGNTYTAGDTGGEATHTLIEGELPNISGTAVFRAVQNSSGTNYSIQPSASGHFTRSSNSSTGNTIKGGSTASNGTQSNLTFEFGSGNSHNKMPPYLAVYIWKRTA